MGTGYCGNNRKLGEVSYGRETWGSVSFSEHRIVGQQGERYPENKAQGAEFFGEIWIFLLHPFVDQPGGSADREPPAAIFHDRYHTREFVVVSIFSRLALKSRGFNGRRTEHQIGEGFTEIDTRALVAMITTSYQKIQQKSGNF